MTKAERKMNFPSSNKYNHFFFKSNKSEIYAQKMINDIFGSIFFLSHQKHSVEKSFNPHPIFTLEYVHNNNVGLPIPS